MKLCMYVGVEGGSEATAAADNWVRSSLRSVITSWLCASSPGIPAASACACASFTAVAATVGPKPRQLPDNYNSKPDCHSLHQDWARTDASGWHIGFIWNICYQGGEETGFDLERWWR